MTAIPCDNHIRAITRSIRHFHPLFAATLTQLKRSGGLKPCAAGTDMC